MTTFASLVGRTVFMKLKHDLFGKQVFRYVGTLAGAETNAIWVRMPAMDAHFYEQLLAAGGNPLRPEMGLRWLLWVPLDWIEWLAVVQPDEQPGSATH